jgi:transaldolase
MPLHGAQTQALLERFTRAGIGIDALAAQLQREGAEAFVKSWRALLLRIADKCQALAP